jgi:excisionase family DNA binding protein
MVFEHRLLTIVEAAAELGVGEKNLRDEIAAGTGPRTRPWGNEQRIPRWELRAWQERQLSQQDEKLQTLVSGGRRPRLMNRRTG